MAPPSNGYLAITALCVVALLFACAPLAIAWVLAPKKPSAIKNLTYECGLISKGDSWIQFKTNYYIYAIAFVIFDIEAVFLYPWAAAVTDVGPRALLAFAFFYVVLAESLFYLWTKRVLEWE